MYDLSKPLFQCTLGEFAEAVADKLKHEPPPPDANMPLMFKGINGIMRIFQCGKNAAIRIKDSGVINDAIIQMSERAFLVNPEKALLLYEKSKQKIV